MSTPAGKSTNAPSSTPARLQEFLNCAAPLLKRRVDDSTVTKLRRHAEELGVDDGQIRELLVRLVNKGTIPRRQMEAILSGLGKEEVIIIDDVPPKPPAPPPLPNVAGSPTPPGPTPPLPPPPPNSIARRQSPEPIPEVSVSTTPLEKPIPIAAEHKQAEKKPQKSRPKKLPQEAFRAYVHKAIDAMSTPVVSTKKESKLAAEGQDKLGLSEVFASSIIYEVAAERGIPVLSQQSDDEQQTDAEREKQEMRLESFLERAPSIIAEQRGINVKSRMLMDAVARELGLDDEEFETAIGLLQGRGRSRAADQKEQQQLRGESFRAHVRTSLSELPRGILTAPLFDELVEAGELYHGVGSEHARQTVRELARDADVRFISKEQAIHHITDLIAEKMAGSARLPADAKQRIFAEGEQWGLSTPEMEEVLHECVEVSRRQRAKSRSISSAAMALACLAVIGLLGVAGWAFLLNGVTPSTDPQPAADGPGVALSSDPTKSTEVAAKSWLDRDLQVAITRARILLRDQKESLQAIREGEAAERAKAYQELLKAKLAAPRADREDSILSVIAACYAIEPSEENASQLRTSIVGLLTPADGESAADIDRSETRFWAVRTGIAAMLHDAINDTRADLMAREMGAALGIVVDRTADLAALEGQCLGALCKRSYRRLTALAETSADGVVEMYEWISRRSNQYLAPDDVEELDTDFLVAVFARDEGDWPDYEELIRRTANSEDPYTVLKLVEVFEQAEDSRLRLMLAGLLLRRTGLLSEPITMGEVATEVRKALGVKRMASQKDRWRQFDEHSQKALREAKAPADDHRSLATEIAELTYLSTLGCALSRGEFGQSAFDEQVEEGFELSKAPTPPPVPPARRGGRPMERTTQHLLADGVQRTIELIASSGRPEQRVMMVGRLKEQSTELRELAPRAAAVLAHYLMEPKSQQEHDLVLPHVEKLSRWIHVRLGMVDELDKIGALDDQISQTMARVLGREFTERDPERWKRQIREELLQSVLSKLDPDSSAAASGTSGGQLYDRLMTSVLEQLLEQAKVLGASADAYRGASRPSQVLSAMIDFLTAQVSGGPLNPESQRYLQQLSVERLATDYLAENDVALTVMRQRTWLKLLSIRLAQERPDRREAGEQLVEALEQQDAAAERLLVQLRDGEAKLVRMWRLLVEPK